MSLEFQYGDIHRALNKLIDTIHCRTNQRIWRMVCMTIVHSMNEYEQFMACHVIIYELSKGGCFVYLPSKLNTDVKLRPSYDLFKGTIFEDSCIERPRMTYNGTDLSSHMRVYTGAANHGCRPPLLETWLATVFGNGKCEGVCVILSKHCRPRRY